MNAPVYDQRRGTRAEYDAWNARRARDRDRAALVRDAMMRYVATHGTLPNRDELAAFMADPS